VGYAYIYDMISQHICYYRFIFLGTNVYEAASK
jgi:hypothetical protein